MSDPRHGGGDGLHKLQKEEKVTRRNGFLVTSIYNQFRSFSRTKTRMRRRVEYIKLRCALTRRPTWGLDEVVVMRIKQRAS